MRRLVRPLVLGDARRADGAAPDAARWLSDDESHAATGDATVATAALPADEPDAVAGGANADAARLLPADGPYVTGGGATVAAGVVLRPDEVSRHAVRLVVVDGAAPRLEPFAALPRLLRAGDLVVVNDAATLPGSLPGRTADGSVFELRLSGPVDAGRLFGVLLGPGDHRTRTEHRGPPPRVAPGDRLTIAGMTATVAEVAGRRVELVVRGDGDALWQALYASGAPVQYAHRSERLALWSVQTAYASRPWAAEMPSAGRPLTWEIILGLRRAGIAIASLTHAAGLSSTGDDALDRALPWPERYEIPRPTIEAIAAARARGGRVIAIGTTVVRALEAAAAQGEPRPGSGVATLRLDASYRPRIVSGLVSGLHVPGESHFELLSAFAPIDRLRSALGLAARHGLSSHELGDACLIVPA
ncbi:MAG TPA: S-adenosylmethionine:tRNA ribosyltransferase-isomerase [Kofleriaceae bacterium]|nr:S-adenosylmethionine:tRNA ribosyltransferase-isomerase [Kofleriaceae bacterium]